MSEGIVASPLRGLAKIKSQSDNTVKFQDQMGRRYDEKQTHTWTLCGLIKFMILDFENHSNTHIYTHLNLYGVVKRVK